jgi:hypothetical protein
MLQNGDELKKQQKQTHMGLNDFDRQKTSFSFTQIENYEQT